MNNFYLVNMLNEDLVVVFCLKSPIMCSIIESIVSTVVKNVLTILTSFDFNSK